MKTEQYTTGTGQRLTVHAEEDCVGNCPIHNPSDHPLKDAPTHWRDDINIMERICECEVGHPDPDDQKAQGRMHGCCGCCSRKREDSA